MGMREFTTALGAVAALFGFNADRDKTFWSLAYCQGDGCVFEGTLEWDAFIAHLLDVDTNLAGNARATIDATMPAVTIRRNSSRYCHAHTASLETDELETAFFDVPDPVGREGLFKHLVEAMEAQRQRACARMERLGYAFLDTGVHEPQTLHRESYGEHALEIRVVPAREGTSDCFPDWGEVDEHLEWLHELEVAPHGRYVTGELELVHVDDEGEETVVESLSGSTYDTTAPAEHLVEERWDELETLRERLLELARVTENPADPSPHATEATPLQLAA
jgi:hypothetical protein